MASISSTGVGGCWLTRTSLAYWCVSLQVLWGVNTSTSPEHECKYVWEKEACLARSNPTMWQVALDTMQLFWTSKFDAWTDKVAYKSTTKLASMHDSWSDLQSTQHPCNIVSIRGERNSILYIFQSNNLYLSHVLFSSFHNFRYGWIYSL